MRQRQPHHPHGLDQVAFQGAAPVVIGAVGDARTAAATADVVDQDVDAAIDGDRGVDQSGRIGGIPNIGSVSGHCGADVAQCRFRLAQRLGRARRQHQPAALGGKRLGGRQADAAARTGDQRDLVSQFQIHAASLPQTR